MGLGASPARRPIRSNLQPKATRAVSLARSRLQPPRGLSGGRVVALLAGPPNSHSRKKAREGVGIPGGCSSACPVVVATTETPRGGEGDREGRERESARARARGERGKIKQVVKGRLALWTQGS
jgi:hypothetical protein